MPCGRTPDSQDSASEDKAASVYLDGNTGFIGRSISTIAFPSIARDIQIGIRRHLYGRAGLFDLPITSTTSPTVATQSAAYAIKQLSDYKSRARDDKNMYKRVRKLDEQQMADLALWYESRPLPKVKPLAKQELKAPQLVNKGDPARAIPPCDICHGKDRNSTAGEIPVLAGQNVDYLVSTMGYFKDGSRSNDPGGAVQVTIKKLSDVEIEALARYYAALGGRPAE